MIALRIVTPLGLYKESKTSILNVETTEGQIGILPGHMPLVAMLGVSHMNTVENDKRESYAVAGGLLYFRDNSATIVTDAAESAVDIDPERALRARERAMERLNAGNNDVDIKRAEAALKRAINRLRLKE